jgi:antitoxin (DNA-binding transcriptional repressor) of toxin-antitoxin stability system
VAGRGPLVWGTSDGLAPGDVVAIAVDGVVVATAVAHDAGGTTGWAAMVTGGRNIAGTDSLSVWRIGD